MRVSRTLGRNKKKPKVKKNNSKKEDASVELNVEVSEDGVDLTGKFRGLFSFGKFRRGAAGSRESNNSPVLKHFSNSSDKKEIQAAKKKIIERYDSEIGSGGFIGERKKVLADKKSTVEEQAQAINDIITAIETEAYIPYGAIGDDQRPDYSNLKKMAAKGVIKVGVAGISVAFGNPLPLAQLGSEALLDLLDLGLLYGLEESLEGDADRELKIKAKIKLYLKNKKKTREDEQPGITDFTARSIATLLDEYGKTFPGKLGAKGKIPKNYQRLLEDIESTDLDTRFHAMIYLERILHLNNLKFNVNRTPKKDAQTFVHVPQKRGDAKNKASAVEAVRKKEEDVKKAFKNAFGPEALADIEVGLTAKNPIEIVETYNKMAGMVNILEALKVDSVNSAKVGMKFTYSAESAEGAEKTLEEWKNAITEIEPSIYEGFEFTDVVEVDNGYQFNYNLNYLQNAGVPKWSWTLTLVDGKFQIQMDKTSILHHTEDSFRKLIAKDIFGTIPEGVTQGINPDSAKEDGNFVTLSEDEMFGQSPELLVRSLRKLGELLAEDELPDMLMEWKHSVGGEIKSGGFQEFFTEFLDEAIKGEVTYREVLEEVFPLTISFHANGEDKPQASYRLDYSGETETDRPQIIIRDDISDPNTEGFFQEAINFLAVLELAKDEAAERLGLIEEESVDE